jgi:2-polyprenyl-3-methyl-5-hydroxy-6-metoxy-1,4-benzoquinol methylase
MTTRDLQRLLEPRIHPGDRVLEIGCAPGKLLAWVAARCQAEVSGLDYSPRGLAAAERLFAALNLSADFRCEDLRTTTFPDASFDVVFSVGVIEHFEDPQDVVARHLRLVKPGGVALMTVPNYRGMYGTIQRYFDAASLDYHNLTIMTCEALERLVPPGMATRARAFPAGRFSAWSISLNKRWPRPIALGVGFLANAVGLLQPADIAAVSPILALEVIRAPK